MATSVRRLRQVLLTGWRSRFRIGVVLAAAALVVSVGLYYKPALQTLLNSGETITAEFDRNYKLTENESSVEMAGLDVGVVSDIETRDGMTVVSMKIDQSALDKLGSKPSARIVPNTVLSGLVSVELTAGGGTGPFTDEVIPNERTRTPVELDRILESLPTPTRESLKSLAGSFGDTLAPSGRAALRDLLRDAPGALKPSKAVLQAAQGTRPRTDLPQLVTNFHTTAAVLSQRRGRLSDIVSSLRDTTAVLAEQSPSLSAGIDTLPEALRDTRAGVVDVRGTLHRLARTSRTLHPAVDKLNALLRELGPVLRKARPLLADLRPLTRDARAVFDQLVPVADRGTQVFDDLRGPVLERVNGPIADTVMSTWRGTGPYEGSGGGFQADHKFYEELGYLAAGADRGSMYQDQYGSMLGFQVGFNLDSPAPAIDGPLTLPDLIEHLQRVTGGRR